MTPQPPDSDSLASPAEIAARLKRLTESADVHLLRRANEAAKLASQSETQAHEHGAALAGRDWKRVTGDAARVAAQLTEQFASTASASPVSNFATAGVLYRAAAVYDRDNAAELKARAEACFKQFDDRLKTLPDTERQEAVVNAAPELLRLDQVNSKENWRQVPLPVEDQPRVTRIGDNCVPVAATVAARVAGDLSVGTPDTDPRVGVPGAHCNMIFGRGEETTLARLAEKLDAAGPGAIAHVAVTTTVPHPQTGEPQPYSHSLIAANVKGVAVYIEGQNGTVGALRGLDRLPRWPGATRVTSGVMRDPRSPYPAVNETERAASAHLAATDRPAWLRSFSSFKVLPFQRSNAKAIGKELASGKLDETPLGEAVRTGRAVLRSLDDSSGELGVHGVAGALGITNDEGVSRMQVVKSIGNASRLMSGSEMLVTKDEAVLITKVNGTPLTVDLESPGIHAGIRDKWDGPVTAVPLEGIDHESVREAAHSLTKTIETGLADVAKSLKHAPSIAD